MKFTWLKIYKYVNIKEENQIFKNMSISKEVSVHDVLLSDWHMQVTGNMEWSHVIFKFHYVIKQKTVM